MKTLLTGCHRFLWFFVLVLVISSCSEDLENPMNLDQEFTKAEIKTLLETNELSGFTDQLLIDILQASPTDKLPQCYETAVSGNTTVFTFNDCEVEGGSPINGVITASHDTAGAGTTIGITYSDFTVGDVGISGNKVFSFANDANDIRFTIESGLQLIMADGTTVKETGTRTIGLVLENLERPLVTLNGEWTVTTGDHTYVAVVENTLETILPCVYVGKGLLGLSKNGLMVSVDFGDGSCDDLALLTYPDGTVEEISLKN